MTESNRINDTTTSAPGKAAEAQMLSQAEIVARCAAAPTASERRRWQVIGLLADAAPLAEIVAATGYRPRTIREIAQRYRACGAAALQDRRAHSQGAPPLLAVALQHELQQALQHPAPDGEMWTGPKVAQWIAAKTGKRIHRQRGWEYLRRLADAPAQMHI
jgi:transposase